MAQRLPVDFVAEYRGVKPAGQFTRKDTGEVVDIPAKLKFELSRDDGDVDLVDVSATALDRAQPPIDYTKFKRGELMHLRGEVMLQDRGSDRDSYFTVQAVVPAKPAVAETPLRQAA